MNMPAVGARVTLRGREGVVSRASLGTMRRQGRRVRLAWRLDRGHAERRHGTADHLRLHEDAWHEIEILERAGVFLTNALTGLSWPPLPQSLECPDAMLATA